MRTITWILFGVLLAATGGLLADQLGEDMGMVETFSTTVADAYYLRKDGSNKMTGKLNMGDQAINDGGSVSFTTVTATTVTAALAGNASTASALASDPAACAANAYVSDMSPAGVLTCAQPSVFDGASFADNVTVNGAKFTAKNVLFDGGTFTDRLTMNSASGILDSTGQLTIATRANGNLNLSPNGVGVTVLSSGNRITSASGPITLGTATVPTATYGDTNDVQMSGECEVKGSLKVGAGTSASSINAVESDATNFYTPAAGGIYNGIGQTADRGLKIGVNTTDTTGANNRLILLSYTNYYSASLPSSWGTPATNLEVVTMAAVDPATNNNRWGSQTHTGTYNAAGDYVFTSGSGAHRFELAAMQAWGIMTFTANISTDAGTVFTVGNITLTAKTSGATGAQFNIGTDLTTTLTNLVTAYNAQAGKNCTAVKYNGTIVYFTDNTAGALTKVTTHTTDTDDKYSFGGATLTGGRDAVTGTPTAGTTLYSAGPVEAAASFMVGGTAGLTDSTSFWMCTDATCVTKCQVTIKGGIITGCP